jgi:hypothetical protein
MSSLRKEGDEWTGRPAGEDEAVVASRSLRLDIEPETPTLRYVHGRYRL